jgi:hypothetical protein
MSFDVLGDMNWLAVIAAAVAYFLLGGLWYAGPVFGKAWQKATGYQMGGERPSSAIYIAPLATCLLSAVATGMLAQATGSDTFGEGIVLGLVVGLGYALALSALGVIFDPIRKPQPATFFVINSAYHVVGLLIAAVIVSIWT